MAERGAGRVVLVDDEALIRMGMQAMLQDLGYEVVGEAGDGQERESEIPPAIEVARARFAELRWLDRAPES